MVIVPKTEEASCYYGKNTKWCTAATSTYNRFDQYNRKGRLYININKKTKEKYQFHFESDEFKDSADGDINLDDIDIIDGTGIYDFYEGLGYELPKPTFELAIKRHDYDLFHDLLHHGNITPTGDDLETAIYHDEYYMADVIFWHLNIENISLYILRSYIDHFDTITSDIYHPNDETNSNYVQHIKDFINHINKSPHIESIDVISLIIERISDPNNINYILSNNPDYIKLVNRLNVSNISPENIKYISNTYDIDIDIITNLVGKLIVLKNNVE